MKINHKMGENIFANYITGKVPVPRIYQKEKKKKKPTLLKFNNKNTKNSIKHGPKIKNKHFTKKILNG